MSRSLKLLVGVMVVAGLAVAGWGGYRFAPALKSLQSLKSMVQGRSSTVAAGSGSTRSVVLLFPGRARLEAETRQVPEPRNRTELGESIVRAIIQGPTQSQERVLTPGAELRAFFLDSSGTAYLDIDRLALGLSKDALGEVRALQSLLESLRRNIPDVTGVKLLVDSKDTDLLWGHIDARRPWTLRHEDR